MSDILKSCRPEYSTDTISTPQHIFQFNAVEKELIEQRAWEV